MNVKQWQVVDLPFDADQPAAQPFDIEFSATFTSDGGDELTVPGFYDGDARWVIRFSPPKTGDWTYTTRSDLASLNGRTGQLTATPSTRPNQHGALGIDPDRPQHFAYEDGTPCMLLAYEADWLFALDYDNPDDVPKTRELLDPLAEHGINHVVTTVYSYDVEWDKDPKLADHPEHEYGSLDRIYPFLGTNADPDFANLNVTFFQRFDRIVEIMNELGLTAHLMIYVWNKRVNWPDADSDADNRYFDYIIKRYQAFPNVVWNVSKEALNNPRCSEAYALERIDRVRRLDAYGRLVTVHDGGFCERNPDAVDFISWQNWSSTLYTDTLRVLEKFPRLPVFNIEHGGYERSPYVVFTGDYTDPEVCLRRNWLLHFAGAYSTYYWQAAAWNVVIHDPFDQPDDWPRPMYAWYRHLADFFHRFPFAEFSPLPEKNFSGYCMHDGRDTWLYYLPKENEKLSSWRWPDHLTSQWFNTLTGAYSDITPSTPPYFVSPWRGEADAVLICRSITN
ncbi:MAG: DUF5060 domain-containing protein [Planctomycetota bacterium]